MRTAFIDELCKLAENDPSIWLVCGDLGYSVLEQFSDRFPDRYLNAGVAEQNMTGIAAGLALEGKTVFTYSIANFPVMRCLEQIRNDVCCHNLKVKIVSIGGGLAYGSHGYSHHGVEDLGVMRCLPNMKVVAPGDPIEARAAVRAMAADIGPGYLRLGKAGEKILHSGPVEFEFGRAIPVLKGSQVMIFSTGGTLGIALDAAGDLQAAGLSVAMSSMPSLAPIDRDAILDAARTVELVVTVEEHGPGGLGSAVAEVMAESGLSTRLRMVRLRHEILKIAGTQDFLRASLGVSREHLVNSVLSVLRPT
jgi:transketolase